MYISYKFKKGIQPHSSVNRSNAMHAKLKQVAAGDSREITRKPQLSFWQIWNMSFGFLGIQFGFALQNANVSRIFQTLGAQMDDISVLWLAAPCTGLLVQPIIGYVSDRTWHPW